jgi:hypothetical protein
MDNQNKENEVIDDPIGETEIKYKPNLGNWSSIISTRIKTLIIGTTKKNWDSHYHEIEKVIQKKTILCQR